MYVQIASLDLRLAASYTKSGCGIINWLSYQYGLGIHYVNLFSALIFMYGVFFSAVNLLSHGLLYLYLSHIY